MERQPHVILISAVISAVVGLAAGFLGGRLAAPRPHGNSSGGGGGCHASQDSNSWTRPDGCVAGSESMPTAPPG